MSKPKVQARKSEPAPASRIPSVGIPPTARKSSSPSVNAQSAGAAPRFYDGPTVNSNGDVKSKAKAAASKTAAATKASTQKAVAKAKRHPWSILSIITAIPTLIIFSLASTVLCPPPGPPSSLNRYILSPLGYEPHQSHPVFCYPANVYHREFLEPYVYPIIEDTQNRVLSSQPYVKYVQPATNQVRSASHKAWNGPIKPVVNRTVRGARRFYLTFVQPHIPYVKAKYYALTAPYTSRISAFAAPHIATVNAYATSASDSAVKGYKYAATHPVTGLASDYAQRGYRLGSQKGYQAYKWSKPHALRARLEVERITREILGPRAVKGLQTAIIQAAKIEAAVRAKLVQLYQAHLEPHVGPYVNKASVALAPYTALFNKHVHQPYIKPTVDHLFPPTDTPKSFLSILADFLPSGSSHAAERKGQMDDFYDDIDHARRPADVKVPDANKVAEKKSAPPAEDASKQEKKERKEQRGIERSEMDRVRDAIKNRVDEQGKIGLKTVKSEINQLHATFTSEQLPLLTQNLRAEIDREIEYITRGLDKLYTSSTSLTKDQVQKSSEQGDLRLKKTVEKIKARLESVKTRLYEDGKPIVRKQFDALDQATGKEYEQLAQQMAWIDDISVKDWDKYNQVKKLAESYKQKYIAIHEDPSLTKPFAELRTELNDYHETFRERVGILKRTAVDRIQAREAMSAEGEPSRVSILPIKEVASAAAGVGAGAIIGKGKDQILDALSQAQAAVQGEASTSPGVVDQARASAESVLNAASSGVHDATRSLSSAVGATPSPESPREHVESVINVASEGLESFVDAATSSVHGATRSVQKAVGVTPSPESVPEHAESVYHAAAEAVDSLSQAAESVIHDATRSAIKAVGGTPTPESPAEHAQSAYNAAGDGANSLASAASEAVHQATRSIISAVGATPSPETPGEHLESLSAIASGSASSVLSAASEAVTNLATDASSVIHDATRSAYSAVGATPSPESAEEYLESIANVVAGGAASVYGAVGDNAASAYDAAGSQIHDGTRSAMKAVGVTPSPETPGEYAESLADAASSAVHEATRSALRAVGVTPSPETPAQHAESIYDAAFSSVSSAGSVVSDQLGSIATQIQEYLGVVPTPEPLASTASAYLASIASAGSSAGSEALESGSSILASLQTQAGANIHQATRALSKAAGATPTPETADEYVAAARKYAGEVGEIVKEKVARNPREIAESLVRKHASQIARDLEQERAAGTTRKIQFGHDHKHDHGVGGHTETETEKSRASAHPVQDEL